MRGTKIHYLEIPLVKMGRWKLSPLDTETWMTEHTSEYFEKLFGFPKGILNICALDDGYMQNYVPEYYFKKIYDYIDNTPDLGRKLETFYALRRDALKRIPKVINKHLSLATYKELSGFFKRIRDWIHRAAVYDQFGWIAENYWGPRMERYLADTLKVERFNDILFALTKPRMISTTLREKRAVLYTALRVKKGEISLNEESELLLKRFGWMPVFTYGMPWNKDHYISELEYFVKKDKDYLISEIKPLMDYSKIRDSEFRKMVRKYGIKNTQIFVDFGIMLDVRNEAEYLVSYASFYLIPIYSEISRRLGITVDELRNMFESEIIDCLEKDVSVKNFLKKGVVAWGFDASMKRRINFNPKESKKLLEYCEKSASIMGGSEGVCASPGKVRGHVKIVPSPKEQYKVNEGDILITYATTVDYLTSMKKAGGIVTEVGGLTCHAAVVSREFGKPCIVGYKDVMVRFKDGDLVKMDADEGVIRKISLL